LNFDDDYNHINTLRSDKTEYNQFKDTNGYKLNDMNSNYQSNNTVKSNQNEEMLNNSSQLYNNNMMEDPLNKSNLLQDNSGSNNTSFKSFKDAELNDSRDNVNYDLYQLLLEKGIANNKLILQQKIKNLSINIGGI